MNEVIKEKHTQMQSPSRFRFRLRTIFVVMAMVAAAIALFIHYGPLPGLIFASFVLLGGACYLRGKGIGALSFLALCAALWLGLQFFGPYTSLRNRIVWIVGTERLQQWAVEVLDSQPPAELVRAHPAGADLSIPLDRDAMPEDIRAIAGNYDNYIMKSADGTKHFVMFEYEGSFYRWAIVIERPGSTWSDPRFFDEIAEGIRGFRHRPQPSPLEIYFDPAP